MMRAFVRTRAWVCESHGVTSRVFTFHFPEKEETTNYLQLNTEAGIENGRKSTHRGNCILTLSLTSPGVCSSSLLKTL